MNGGKTQILIGIGLFLAGYMLSKTLDQVPVINKLPQIRIRF